MDVSSPALGAARALARVTGASLVPVDGDVPDGAANAILLADRTPDDDLLHALSAALPGCTAIVVWATGWDEQAALEQLGRHGFEHGAVSVIDVPDRGILAILVSSADAAAEVSAALAHPVRPFRTLAIMPAYNEEDVIFHAIGALVSEGVDVYLIDHESTDGTVQAARPWLGRGLVHIERFPGDAGYPERNRREMVWRDILRRVQEVASEVPADWYTFTNADEFREAPWPRTTLADGLREVDELGYTAVKFELFDFRPTDDNFEAGADPRDRLRYYEPGGRHDILQIKAWKRPVAGSFDLVEHGGHDVLMDGKRVFPVPFILRHYPIRSSGHGSRKVLGERLPRFAAEEREKGWHVQYDRYANGASFLHDSAELKRWDAEAVRAELLASAMRDLLLCVSVTGADPARCEPGQGFTSDWLARRQSLPRAGFSLEAGRRLLEALRGGGLGAVEPVLQAALLDLSRALEAHARLRGDMIGAASIADARHAAPVSA